MTVPKILQANFIENGLILGPRGANLSKFKKFDAAGRDEGFSSFLAHPASIQSRISDANRFSRLETVQYCAIS